MVEKAEYVNNVQTVKVTEGGNINEETYDKIKFNSFSLLENHRK